MRKDKVSKSAQKITIVDDILYLYKNGKYNIINPLKQYKIVPYQTNYALWYKAGLFPRFIPLCIKN